VYDITNPTVPSHFDTDIVEMKDVYVSMRGNITIRFTMSN